MIVDRTLQAFLDDLASASTTPGGGSAGALMGAMGAALVAMVCRLTIGRSGYEAVDAEMRSVLAAADTQRARLTAMVQRDVEAFESVMRAYGLPKDSAAIQAALQVATEVPLECARASAAVIALAAPAAENGNRTAASDAGAGAVAAQAALQTAALNVHANAALLTDRAYADTCVREVDALLAESAVRLDAIRQALARRR